MKRICVIAVTIVCGIVAILLFANNPSEPAWHVFSSTISPDDTLVAENAMENGEDGGGRISVRRTNGLAIYEAAFAEVLPSIFMKWIDLLVLSDSRSQLPSMTFSRKEGAPEVRYSAYVRIGAADASVSAKSRVALSLEPNDVSARFSAKNYSLPPVKHCSLDLSAKDGKKYSHLDMTMMAAVYPCGPRWLKAKLCGGVSSHFSVSQTIDNAGYDLLTSATVSEISSYNELPDGAGYHAIRGQFLGSSAILLLEELKKPSFEVDYSFDFNRENVRYSVPTSSISEPLNEFAKCVGSPIFP